MGRSISDRILDGDSGGACSTVDKREHIGIKQSIFHIHDCLI